MPRSPAFDLEWRRCGGCADVQAQLFRRPRWQALSYASRLRPDLAPEVDPCWPFTV